MCLTLVCNILAGCWASLPWNSSLFSSSVAFSILLATGLDAWLEQWERAVGWELRPRGPACATDSVWPKANHDPFLNLSFLIRYTRHWNWGDLRVQVMVLLILLHLSHQSHPHSLFLHGAHPFRLIAGCWRAVQEHLKRWKIHLKLIRHNRTCRWLLFPFDSWPLGFCILEGVHRPQLQSTACGLLPRSATSVNGRGEGKSAHLVGSSPRGEEWECWWKRYRVGSENPDIMTVWPEVTAFISWPLVFL